MTVAVSLLCGMLVLLALADGFVAPVSLASSSASNSQRGRALNMNAEDEGYVSWLTHKVERARRPPFVKIARPRLQRDFAVLLMRSSYQVTKACVVRPYRALGRRKCVACSRLFLVCWVHVSSLPPTLAPSTKQRPFLCSRARLLFWGGNGAGR